MFGIRVEITRWIEDYQPGIIECKFTDAFGEIKWFIEKAPIVWSSDDLNANSDYPQPGIIECQIVDWQKNSLGVEVLIVDTSSPCLVESTEGETQFTILSEQLIEYDLSYLK